MLRGFKPRLYQETILATASLKNTLVVLPTGMGKTGVALLLSVQRLKQHPDSKVIILAPTKPLAEQHLNTFREFSSISEDELVLFTGEVAPKLREELYENVRIIFSTPQGLENDIIGDKIDLKNVSLVVFDEAHRAVGDYSYVFLAKQYQRKAEWPRILALTASPGSDSEKISEVCKNLFIEAVEIRTENDPDVKPYIQDVEIKTIRVELTEELKKIKTLLDQCIKRKIGDLRIYGLKGELFTKKDLLAAQAQLHRQMASGSRNFEVLKSVSILAEIMKAQHALELLETQGVIMLNKYLDKLFAEAVTSKVKAVKNLCADSSFKSARILAQSLLDKGIEHPKIKALVDFIEGEIKSDPKTKLIVFTQFRDSASKLHDEISNIKGVLSEIFVGQAKKGSTGLTQKKQIELLDMFRDGMFNVLIATSVAEEGLDIPKVDTVVFYEPIPSSIRHIQRRGRTGRLEKGKVVIFLTKGTREEAYSWSAKHKEQKMVKVLDDMSKNLNMQLAPQQPSLSSFDSNVKIFADYREKGTGTVKELVELGASVNLEMLKSADYILSSRVGVELKLVDDFVASIIDGRLLEQLKQLKRNFERPIVIVQGKGDIYSVRNVHPNAIRGMLSTIAISYGIPIVYTRDEKDTAALLLTMARREQEESSKHFSPHADRKPVTMKDQQEYIVSAFPSVGPGLAKVLLEHFKTIHALVNASEEDLLSVKGVGPKIAKQIKDLLSKEYEN